MPPKSIEEVLKETKIHEILRPKLVTAQPGISLRQALDLMRAEKAGYIVVADRHLKVTGLFTEREVLMKVLCKGVSLDEPIDRYMKTPVKTLMKSATVGEAIKFMNDEKVRHIPLVDEFGQMNGVLSIRTIVAFLAELFPVEVFNLPPKADQIHDQAEGG